MKLPVPYYSQFVDIQDPFWMLRACGAVSLKMVSEFHGVDVPEILTLCNEARDRGGYHVTNGWVHDYLVLKAKELGLEAFRKEGLTSFDEIKNHLDVHGPVIVSVEKRVLEQTRFHLLVVTGHDDEFVYYNEPESTDKAKGEGRSCAYNVFMRYFRGKAIFISK
jgi:uncharacterized protein YvpB